MYKVVDNNESGWRYYTKGTRDEVYGWLKANSQLDTPGLEVLDCETKERFEEGEFIRKYKEEAKSLQGHKCLTEDDVRRIVDKRLKEVFAFAVEITQETIDYQDTPEDERAGFGWIQSVFGVTLEQYLEGKE